MTTLLTLTLSGSALALLLLALRYLLLKRMPSTVYYYAWLLVLLRFVLPLPGFVPVPGRKQRRFPRPHPFLSTFSPKRALRIHRSNLRFLPPPRRTQPPFRSPCREAPLRRRTLPLRLSLPCPAAFTGTRPCSGSPCGYSARFSVSGVRSFPICALPGGFVPASTCRVPSSAGSIALSRAGNPPCISAAL